MALTRLAWPGNVRQLENTCRWLTVMAAGQEVLTQDLPSELFETAIPDNPTQMLPDSWATLLGQWADRALRSGHQNLLSEAQPEMERTLLTTALLHQCAEDNFDITDRDLLSDKPLKDIRNTLNR